MNNRIPTIEINTSNLCSANCFCCSREHGSKNLKLMMPDVFTTMRDQLKEIDFDTIHVSGNGCAFLNKYFMGYLETLRTNFPKAKIDFYSSFALFDKDKSDEFINKNLVDEVHVRIDSLNPWIFEKATGLKFNDVFNNLEYFLYLNKKIKFFVNYGNIRRYYERCRDILDREPYYGTFDGGEVNCLTNEYEDIKKWFNARAKCPIEYHNVAWSLWAERIDCKEDYSECCPKLGAIKNTVWLCPNGDLSMSPYDDRQSDMVYGNIHNKTILELWNSPKRAEWLWKIENREVSGYPCKNSKLCCQM